MTCHDCKLFISWLWFPEHAFVLIWWVKDGSGWSEIRSDGSSAAKLLRLSSMWPLWAEPSRLQPLKYQPSRCCPIIAFTGLMDASWALQLWTGFRPISHSDKRLWSQSRGKIHKNVQALKRSAIRHECRHALYKRNPRWDRSRDLPIMLSVFRLHRERDASVCRWDWECVLPASWCVHEDKLTGSSLQK